MTRASSGLTRGLLGVIPAFTGGSQAVYAKFLKGTDVFKHEIKCVDLGVILADRGELGFSVSV